MLDVETKNRINTARDILVGKVPDPKSQVEQITIALIYKFMDDMDVESEEMGRKRTFFRGEFSKYAWSKIFDPRQSAHELLNLYSEAIAKMDTNPGVPKLFRDIFKNAYLPYRDPETLKSFLKIINEFEYSHSEKLGDAFEFLLSILGSQGDAGQFRTPRHIIDFMVAIINPKKHETILDPACGTAGFLITSYKHIIKQNSSNYTPDEEPGVETNGTRTVNEVIITRTGYSGDKLTANERSILAGNMWGYDISPDMVRLSLVNMYLHGIKEPEIFEYDTLTSKEYWHQYSDVILANPPFMSPKGGIRPHKRFSVQSNRSEVLFVDYIAEHLTPDGRAAVIVPEGIIFQSGKAYKQLRKMLVDNYLIGVISLPAGVFQPYSGIKTSILWLDKSLAKKTDKILFVKIENDGFDSGAQRKMIKENNLPEACKIIELFKTMISEKRDGLKGNEKVFIIEKSRLAENEEYNLSLDRYASKKILITDFNTIKLKEICEFNSGLWTGKKGPFLKVKVIRNANFRKDGLIDWTNIAELEVEQKQFNSRELIRGDIVLEKSGGGPTQPVGRVVLFDRDEKGFSYSNFTSLIRVRRNDFSSQFLWIMLRDFYFRGKTEKYQKQTSGIRNLDFNLYKEVRIPYPPLHLQLEIVREVESYQKIIDGARQVVENYKPQIDIDPGWEIVELGSLYQNLDGKRIPITKSDRKSGIFPYYGASGIVDYVENYLFDEDLLLISEDGANLLARSTPIAFSVSGKIWVNNHAHVLRFENMETRKYVEFYINSIPIEHYVTGAAQPKLNQKALNSIRIPLPDLNIQKQTVNRIEKENGIVNSNRELLKIFEQKIKDRIARVWGE